MFRGVLSSSSIAFSFLSKDGVAACQARKGLRSKGDEESPHTMFASAAGEMCSDPGLWLLHVLEAVHGKLPKATCSSISTVSGIPVVSCTRSMRLVCCSPRQRTYGTISKLSQLCAGQATGGPAVCAAQFQDCAGDLRDANSG